MKPSGAVRSDGLAGWAAAEIESCLEARRTDGGRSREDGASFLGRRSAAPPFPTFLFAGNVAVVAVALFVVLGQPETRDAEEQEVADQETYWVRRNDTTRMIVARHVSRDSPVSVDQVYAALDALSPAELRGAGFPVDDLSRLLMGHTIDSVSLRRFVESTFGARAVRRASAEDREHYMLRRNDTMRSLLARMLEGEGSLDPDRALDELRALSSEELRHAGIRKPLVELRTGDEINVVQLRKFMAELSN